MGIVEMIREREIKAIHDAAIEESKVAFVKNLLAANICTVSQIAKIAGVTEKYVREIKKSTIKL